MTILSGVLLLTGVAFFIANGSQSVIIIKNGFNTLNGIVTNVEDINNTHGGIVWLASYGGLWLVLIIMADAGGEELAVVLAGLIFSAVLFSNLALGKLQAGITGLKA